MDESTSQIEMIGPAGSIAGGPVPTESLPPSNAPGLPVFEDSTPNEPDRAVVVLGPHEQDDPEPDPAAMTDSSTGLPEDDGITAEAEDPVASTTNGESAGLRSASGQELNRAIVAAEPGSDALVDNETIPQCDIPTAHVTDERSGAMSGSGEVIMPTAATLDAASSAVKVWPKPHTLARIFPPMDETTFAGLKASIAAEGLREPITLHEGQVLDGCNRLDACRELEITPNFQDFSGPGTPLEFVVARNMHRRHMDESQRALVAARVASMSEGRPSKTAQIQAVSQDKAAEMFSVSRTSVQHAATVVKKGVPELGQAVASRKLRVSAAARIAKLDPQQQRERLAQMVEATPTKPRQARTTKRNTGQSERIENATVDEGNNPSSQAPVILGFPCSGSPARKDHHENLDSPNVAVNGEAPANPEPADPDVTEPRSDDDLERPAGDDGEGLPFEELVNSSRQVREQIQAVVADSSGDGHDEIAPRKRDRLREVLTHLDQARALLVHLLEGSQEAEDSSQISLTGGR